MNIWENAVVTIKGLSLLSKLVEGNTLDITRAETGEGYVTPGLLSQLTEVSSPKQALSFRAVSYPEEGKCQIPCYLTNDGLEAGYTTKQVGVYATDPDEGEILFLILQAPSGYGTVVPSEAESPGYSAEWTLYMQYGQADGVNVNVDPSNTVSTEEFEKFKVEVEQKFLDKPIHLLGIPHIGSRTISEFDDYTEGVYVFPTVNRLFGMGMSSRDVYACMIAATDTQFFFNLDGKNGISYRIQNRNKTWGDLIEFGEADQTYSPTSTTAQSGIAVAQALASLVNSAPEALNTLDELAQAMGDDPNFSATVLELIGKKVNTEDLADVATSGNYEDLTNKPVYQVSLSSEDGVNYTGTIDGLNSIQPGLQIIVSPGKTSTTNAISININELGKYGVRSISTQNSGLVTYSANESNWFQPGNKYLLVFGTLNNWIYDGRIGLTPEYIGAAPAYTYGTDDMEAGVTELETGKLHFVYE